MFLDSILGKNLLMENNNSLDIKVAAKIGTPQMITYGQIPPFVRYQ